jgi:hypothetical protein
MNYLDVPQAQRLRLAMAGTGPGSVRNVQCHASRVLREEPGTTETCLTRRVVVTGESYLTAMQKLRIVTVQGFRVGDIAHAAVSRRPPIFLHTMVPRTGGYAYDVGV